MKSRWFAVQIFGVLAAFVWWLIFPNAAPALEIHRAAKRGDLAAVQNLLEKNPKLVKAKDIQGATALHKAVEEGHLELAVYLLAHGARVNARALSDGTPLHVAPNAQLAQLLLDHGASLTLKDKKVGDTALHSAAWRGHPEVCAFLLEKGLEVNVKNRLGYTPLHSAAAFGRIETAAILVANGADLNARNHDGWTPLHLAAGLGQKEMTAWLMDHGADPNRKDKFYGATPLHWAAGLGRKEMVEILVGKGAAVNVRNREGQTPLQLALDIRRFDIADFLRQHGAEEPSSP